MKKIVFEKQTYDVIDETSTHYVCPPFRLNEGYHFISKDRALIVDVLGAEHNKLIIAAMDDEPDELYAVLRSRGHAGKTICVQTALNSLCVYVPAEGQETELFTHLAAEIFMVQYDKVTAEQHLAAKRFMSGMYLSNERS